MSQEGSLFGGMEFTAPTATPKLTTENQSPATKPKKRLPLARRPGQGTNKQAEVNQALSESTDSVVESVELQEQVDTSKSTTHSQELKKELVQEQKIVEKEKVVQPKELSTVKPPAPTITKNENGKLEIEKLEKEKLEKEKKEKEKLEKEKLEKEKLEKEKLEKKRLEDEKVEQERLEQERIEQERLEEEEREKFLVIGKLKNIQSRRLKARENLDKLIDQQSLLEKERSEFKSQLTKISDEKSNLEKQQMEAIETDDYDKAEEISYNLDNLRRSASEIYMKILELSKQSVLLEKEKPSHFDKVIAFEESIISESESLKDEQEERVNDLKKKLREEREDGEFRLGNEERRIEKKISNVEIELANVIERNCSVQATIDEKTVDQREAKEVLLVKKADINKEIEELLALVAAKREEEAQIDSKIGAVDVEINNVKSKFQKEISNIQHETETLEEEKRLFLTQKENVEKQKVEFESKMEKLTSSVQREEITLRDLIESKERCVGIKKDFDRQAISIKETSDSRQTELLDLETLRKEIDSLWAQKDNYQQEISNISLQELALDREIRHLTNTITDLTETTLVGLNKKKTTALSAKNFKLVKTLKEEIDEIEADIVEKKNQLENKKNLVLQTTEDSKIFQEKLQDMLEKVKELEVEWDEKSINEMKGEETVTSTQ